MARRALAHTPGQNGEWHLLVDHLTGTAERAAEFARPFGAAEVARTVGWLHDAGKCSDTFSAYLLACDAQGDEATKRNPAFRSRDHKTPGALRAASLDNAGVGPFLAATILGHHGGLHDLTEVRGRLAKATTDPIVAETLARFADLVGEAPFALSAVGPPWATKPPAAKQEHGAWRHDIEMLWRLVFSALVDADFLDTEAHFRADAPAERAPDRPLTGLLDRLGASRRQQLSHVVDTPVNRARSEMYDSVVSRSGDPPGLYSLAAPTGAGKTHMGLAWALSHASAHGLRRIVTAVPFISVTDQVAGVYRELLNIDGDAVVVEHHSEVAGDDGWQKLATENWDAPVIVTTTVRLFESLFSNRTSACRRLHRLARSVIVLDEAQAIPVEVLEPVVDGLRALVDRFGASVLVMTATPPSLEHIGPTAGRPLTPVLPDVGRWSGAFRRTEVVQRGPVDHAEVASMVAAERQCLCVVNTISDAREITQTAGPGVLHLSTRLRPADRRARLLDIRRRLHDGLPCRVVSTQLVEAGVDLDFPMVMRALAPLPSLAQADGRCNRDGRMAPDLGQTIIFDLIDAKPPLGAYYGAGTSQTKVILARGADIREPATIADWYELFLNDPAVDMDKRTVQRCRDKFRYESTASAFRMIDDDQMSVAVPWPDGHPDAAAVQNVLAHMRGRQPVGSSEARLLQPITVSIPRWHAAKAESKGLAERVTDHLLEWRGEYDDNLGLMFSPTPMEALVW
ncbi:MAG: CRISPR-associated endonuclease Cas3'' [Acidimicrobiales bacterium]